MQLLLIGDSHCRHMAEYIHQQNSDVNVLTVFEGDQIPVIVAKYRAHIPAIIAFNPTRTIIHVGHNDLARHHLKNPRPLVSRDVSRLSINLANEVRANHPATTVFLSSVFPRTFTKYSNLTEPQIMKYNETAKRHGQRLRTRATEAGHECILTSILWKTISNHKEAPQYYLAGGLHLKPDGSKGIASEWLKAIFPPATPADNQ
jgi:lysophospholipase L1-like esterase